MPASAIGIILDPSEVATNRTELNINSGAIRIASEGPNWGDAAIAAAIADRKFGSVPVGYRIPNRVITIPLIVRAVSGTTFNQAQTKLQQKVARFQDEGGWLKRVSSNGTTKLYADVVNASLTFPDPRFQDIEGGVVLTLECLPDFYGTEAAGKATTASSGDNDSLIFTETDIPGDYPARSRYTFTDTGSQARQAVLIASQSKTYDSAATAALSYEAEALTVLDAAAIVTQTGAHGGASNNAVEHAAIGPQWTPILSTQHAVSGHLTHWGNYRVFARVYATPGEARVRLEYSAGDAAMRRENPVQTIAGDGGFYIHDLGEIRIPRAQVGTQRWQGEIYAYADAVGTNVGVDKIWLAPTESLSIVKARRAAGTFPEVSTLGFLGRDEFNQAAGNLNGKTADLGGNWATSTPGSASTDFAVNGSGVMSRSSTSETGGRFAVLGALSGSDVAVSTLVKWSGTSSSGNPTSGVVARYNSVSDFVYATLEQRSSETVLKVASPAHQAEVTLGSLPVATYYLLSVYVAGYQAFATLKATSGSQLASVSTPVAGGSSSGGVGIWDLNDGANAITRTYERFIAWALDTADAACLSGGILSAAHDGAFRQTPTSGVYAPAHVEGSYPRAPASGLEARTCRTLVLPSAGDLNTIPDADPLAFSVASAHSPCFLFAPEE